MAELPSSNITVTHAKNALSNSSNNVSTLAGASNINKWSFYRSRPNTLDGSLIIQLGTAYAASKLADFRKYDHAAVAPSILTPPKNYNEGTTNVNIEVDFRPERTNIIEVAGGHPPYILVEYYKSAANRDARTSRQGTTLVLLDLYTITPPAGHSNNQTQEADIQLVEATIPTSYMDTTPNGTVYVELSIANSSGTPLIRFLTGKGSISITRRNNPKLSAEAQFTYGVLGYDAVALIRMDGNLTDADTDLALTAGNGTVSANYALVGFDSSTSKAYRLGATSFSGRLRRVTLSSGTINYTLAQNSLASGSNATISTTNLFGTNNTFTYGDICYLVYVSASGITQGAELTITNSPF